MGGISRGAEWALRLALKRADLFGAAGMHSISAVSTRAEEARAWAQAVPVEYWPRLRFDIGYSDPLVSQMQGVLQELDALELPYEVKILPGEHSDTYWSENIEEYLAWYSLGWW